MQQKFTVISSLLCAGLLLAGLTSCGTGDNSPLPVDTDTPVSTFAETTAPSSSESSKGLEFVLNDDLLGYTCVGMGSCTDTQIVIDTYQGLPVTAIADKAFYNHVGLTSFTLGNSIQSIGYDAFQQTGYYNNEANWESGILYIGKHLVAIKEDFQGHCNIKEGTLSISTDAFRDRMGITSVTIPHSITRIDDNSFKGCVGLTTVTIGNGVTAIGEQAFDGCIQLENITLGENIKSIGEKAFYDCMALKSIELPQGLTTIGSVAFGECVALTTITIPSSVTAIEKMTCMGCNAVTDVYFSGTQAEWNALGRSGNIGIPKSATIHTVSSDNIS